MDEQNEQKIIENETEEQSKQEEGDQKGVQLNAQSDPRMNPLFLKVAEYFGVTEKTYRLASEKINTIIDWAVADTETKNPADIILKIAETSRSLQSPGYGEHRWAILHRYVKLLNKAKPLDDEIRALKQKRADIEKEMMAYKNVT